MDKIRKEAKKTLEYFDKQGVNVKIISGDNPITVSKIAKQVGVKNYDKYIDMTTINEERNLEEIALKHTIFGRVSPTGKKKLVEVMQKAGKTVAMTGDGVNDAPSIKSADIGISMGITGTDVTKGASDMVLADDNFATIVNAVEEGRKIYDNIRKVLQFQLSTNAAEVIYVFLASVFGINIVTPAQLLWINMVTDSTPGLALGMEKAEGNVMKRKPRNSNESIFANGTGFAVIIHGILMALIVIASFFIGQHMELGKFGIFESVDGMTMAFLTANFIEIFYAICMRSQNGSIFKMKTRNPWLLGAFALSILFTLGVIYIPFFSGLFGLASINLAELSVAFGLAFAIVPLVEIFKLLKKRSK